jgi:D-alanine-D-alanine ligase
MALIRPLKISESARRRLKVMFIAKHALGSGQLHPEDGNHAVYHHEIRGILDELGFELTVANWYDALFEKPDVDFVFTLLNRGGFLNSEMMAPLLLTMHKVPFLGASPILRGAADDKHLTKLAARARGVPTLDWAIFRRGAPVDPMRVPKADRWVIKPNASSASWGISDAHDHKGVAEQIVRLHDEGHDAIVEPFMPGSDIEVPVIGVEGPVIMPMMEFAQFDPTVLRTYWEKRDLKQNDKYVLKAFDDAEFMPKVRALTQEMLQEFWPFDYGRFEFRLNRETGKVIFGEVNLQCNLWSQKVFGRAAKIAGISHAELIETIICHSMRRQGVIAAEEAELKAA